MDPLEKLAEMGWETRNAHFPPAIVFTYPRQTQPISVTGPECELNCAHCGRHYLKTMKPLAQITEDGANLPASCLISGGCTASGKVPIGDHLARLAALKQGRRFNLHTGLVDEEEIPGIAAIADVISFDFVGDNNTIRDVFGINRTVDDYCRCYQKLRSYCKVIPHVCIGLDGGKIRGEYRALELLKEIGADGLTLLIFKPTQGTRFAERTPPELAEAVKLLTHARLTFPDIPVQLGCMRPGGRYRSDIDQWAVRVGVNAIVNPARAAVHTAKNLGLTVVCKEECCAL